MSDLANLLQRAAAYGEKHKIEPTTVSKHLFGDWRRLQALAEGTSFLRPPTLISALERMTALEARPLKQRTEGASDGQAHEPAGECRSEGSVTSENRESRSRG